MISSNKLRIPYSAKRLIQTVVVAWGLLESHLPGMCQSSVRSDEVTGLLKRISAPTTDHMHAFTESGMTGVRPHNITSIEQTELRNALEKLPAVNLDALSRHLHQLAFVDGVPGEGTGLTGPASVKAQYDMTLRASLFGESLSEFLTKKDRFVFVDDHSGVMITVTSAGTDALTYVLLHESTYILDFSCSLTSTLPNKLGPRIWTSSNKLAQLLDTKPAAQTHFRGKPEIPLRKAAELYTSLATSPFVSFYATASPQEDLAELVAHREIAQLAGRDITISVQVPGCQSALVWHPLTFPGVKDRLVQVDGLERLESGCPVD